MAGLFSADAWSKIWTYRSTFLLGLENTALTAVFALALALVLGILFGLLATSGNRVLAFIARVYVEVIQNTPVLLQMCFLYYALAFSDHSIGIIKAGKSIVNRFSSKLWNITPRKHTGGIPCSQYLCYCIMHLTPYVSIRLRSIRNLISEALPDSAKVSIL